MKSLTSEIKEFFASADWYKHRCIPYQRGYLLYGKPGNGKTSLVLALASRFGLDVYVAKVAGTSDDTFRSLMSQVPRHSIVLIEDVDCFFVHRESQVTGNIVDGDLTFSGFLNAIDGVTGSDGRILVMTTNQKDLLDAALIRPGRVDRQIELRNASKEQARRLFLNFFPENEAGSLDFAQHLPDDHSLSMADLQGILLDNRNDSTKAVQAMVERKTSVSL